MRKILFAVVAVTAVTVVLASGGQALAASASVKGDVTKAGQAVSGAAVTVQCKKDATHTYERHETTTSTGHYYVSFGASCPNGSALDVVVESAQGSGHATGVMGAESADQAVVDVALDTVTALPEFPLPLAAAALVASGGALMLARRRFAD